MAENRDLLPISLDPFIVNVTGEKYRLSQLTEDFVVRRTRSVSPFGRPSQKLKSLRTKEEEIYILAGKALVLRIEGKELEVITELRALKDELHKFYLGTQVDAKVQTPLSITHIQEPQSEQIKSRRGSGKHRHMKRYI
ncbi:hypothetical protein LIER_33544 [Lithospermum erythrorhizon]|uniref:Uncharacterized protein n=1 Tax=Lithospermum erythrorhizon TaxID=34254 RepID=A0AAV3S272_LITER